MGLKTKKHKNYKIMKNKLIITEPEVLNYLKTNSYIDPNKFFSMLLNNYNKEKQNNEEKLIISDLEVVNYFKTNKLIEPNNFFAMLLENYNKEKQNSEEKLIITEPEVINYFKINNLIDPNNFIAMIIDNYNKEKQTINETIIISPEDLIKINNDYTIFTNKRNILVETVKEMQHIINKMKLDNIDTFISNNCKTKRKCYVCDICNSFSVLTKKGLSVHKRKCIKDLNESDNDENEEEIIT
jgi:hypothetical protein